MGPPTHLFMGNPAAGRLPDLFRFLACIILFQAGVATVVVVAAIYAQESLGFDIGVLMQLLITVLPLILELFKRD